MARIVLEELFQARTIPSGAPLTEEMRQRLNDWTKRILKGEPLQYVVGNAHFYGLVFEVDTRVLIPRPETQELVHWILEDIRGDRVRVLDIGTGSGCIAVTLKKKRPQWALTALDISPGALELAAENAQRHDCSIGLVQHDILNENLPPELGQFHVIVSNPPYIPPQERALMPEQVLHYEPQNALFVPDADPLLFYRAIAGAARRLLLPGGDIFLEVNEFRASEVADILPDKGFESPEIRMDMQGKPRMVKARFVN